MRTFSVADGLAHSSIRRVVSDSTGLLWFCTEGGLSRFDGSGFVTYGIADGLASRVVNDIVEDSPGATYWVATSEGLYRFHGNQAPKSGRLFERVEILVGGAIRRLLLDRRGRIWIATTEGVAVLERAGSGERTRRVLPEAAHDVTTVFALLETPDGAVWAGTQADGLFRIAPDGSAVRHFSAATHGLSFIRDLLQGPDGRIWCTFFGGIARFRPDPERYDNPVAEVFETSDGVPSFDTSVLLADRAGGILAGTTAGVARLERDGRGAWRVVGRWTMRDGLVSDAVRSLAYDSAGSLWIGTIARGAMKLVPEGFRRYRDMEESASILVGLIPDGTTGMLALSAIAQERYRIHRLTESGETSLDVKLPTGLNYLGWGAPRIALAHNGGFWVATGQGLLRYDALRPSGIERLRLGPQRRFGPEAGLPGSDIFWVGEDARGTLWVSVADAKDGVASVARLDVGADRFTVQDDAVTRTAGLVPNFALGPDGTMWLGLFGGRIIHIDEGGRARPIVFDPPLSTKGYIRPVFDAKGRLWILGEGAWIADHPLADTVRLRSGPSALDGVRVNCAVEDGAGRLYFGTERGLFRLGDAHDAGRLFTSADGLPGDSIAYCARDATGSLWFADAHGVASLRPAAEPESPPLRARLAAIAIDGESLPMPPLGEQSLGPIELAPGPHRVAAQFFAIDQTPGERILFQHRFEGRTEWSPPSDARTLEFPRLGPGHHRLLVRAVQALGATAPPVVLDLLIPAPVWQRWWFIAIAAATATAAASAVYRMRVARLLALERMRTRIATDLHDAVGADLSRISLLADFAQRDVDEHPVRARTLLGEVARTARDAVREMSDIVWALQSKPADLSQILGRVRDFAAEVAGSSGIALRVSSAAEPEATVLGDERRRELYLLLKEAVSNAIRHSGAHTLAIEIRASRGGLVAEVKDDGRGFDPASPPTSLGGRGLGNMRSRAARLGGTLTLESALGRGTTVRVELPSA